jgi:uncharacterized protein YyaL (SSP411 family)
MNRNRLGDSLSPYLRQHSENPVWWQPWDEEALNLAREQDKPIFLSIGYASCHWCHVMEHESFEDPEVAALLNEYFIPIKVDREERPDIDDVYMTALQLTRAHGGWPLSAFLTPDGKPFFLGTYFPKEDRDGYPGFRTLLLSVARAWREDRDRLRAAAEELANAVRESNRTLLPGVSLSQSTLRSAVQTLLSRFDREKGGFVGRPKFPPHNAVLLCLDLLEKETDAAAEEFVRHTLRRMALGGIFDHVGGGFHRYSTDADWHLPHFEKMLYDNALLVEQYARAARLWPDDGFGWVAQRTAEFLLAEMLAPDGTFYCALDADSQGREGAYYVWRADELRKVLGNAAEEFLEFFGVSDDGNFEEEATGRRTGENVLHARASYGERFGEALAALREARSDRPRPGLDDKRLISWNGLAIRALAVAGHRQAAERCADAWLTRHPLPYELSGNQAAGIPFLDAMYFVHGLLTLGGPYREAAEALFDSLRESLWDRQIGWRLSGKAHGTPVGPTAPTLDSSMPSPCAYAVLCESALGHSSAANEDLRRYSGWMTRAPQATASLWRAYLAACPEGGTIEPAVPIPKVTLFPKTATLEAGVAKYSVTIEAPEAWTVAQEIALEVEGLDDFRVERCEGTKTREAVIEFRARPRENVEAGEAEAMLTFAICSDTECLPPETVKIPLAWRR